MKQVKLTEEATQILSKGYLLPGETFVGMCERLADTATKILLEEGLQVSEELLNMDLRHILVNQWLGPATPVISNFGTDRGLPISCNEVSPDDSLEDILRTLTEAGAMSKLGAGVGVDLSRLRPEGSPFAGTGVSSGALAWAKIYDTAVASINQAGTRRGNFSFFIDIESADFDSFIAAKNHTIGDHRRHLDSNIGVMIGDSFMVQLLGNSLEARRRFELLLKCRLEHGSPYVIFRDNRDREMPEWLRAANRRYSSSNICVETTPHSDSEHSFVCCLSSLNLDRFDDWYHWRGATGFGVVQLSIFFLDAVMQEYINKLQEHSPLAKARRLAIQCRPLGLGVMGWHSLLQQRLLPWSSPLASELNESIFRYIREEADEATLRLGRELGASAWSGLRRNSVCLAVAPTMTNSVIADSGSPGIEPLAANITVSTGAKGVFQRRNKNLEKLLQSRFSDVAPIWNSILGNRGSVQHLGDDILTPVEREVYLTAFEIDQMSIIKQASVRQKYLDQSQSINLFFSSNVSAEEYYKVHLNAWQLGLFSLYYIRSLSATAAASSDSSKVAIVHTKDGCPYCDAVKEVLSAANFSIINVPHKHPQWPTFPAVVINGQLIGGLSETSNLLQSVTKVNTGDDCVACEG